MRGEVVQHALGGEVPAIADSEIPDTCGVRALGGRGSRLPYGGAHTVQADVFARNHGCAITRTGRISQKECRLWGDGYIEMSCVQKDGSCC